MAKKMYTDEIKQYLADNVEGRRISELTQMINAKFGTGFKEGQIRSLKSNMKLKNGLGTGPIHSTKITTVDQDAFILKHYKGLYTQQLTDLVNYWFGTSFTVEQMKSYKGRNKLDSGLTAHYMKGNEPFNKGMKQEEYMSPEMIERTKATRFKKGQKPVNWQPIGFERITRDGYTEIKVRDKKGVHSTKNFELKHRYLYEKYHDETLTVDDVTFFLDQDKQNFDKDNLVKITRIDLGRLNKILSNDPSLNSLSVAYAKLKAKTIEIEEAEVSHGR